MIIEHADINAMDFLLSIDRVIITDISDVIVYAGVLTNSSSFMFSFDNMTLRLDFEFSIQQNSYPYLYDIGTVFFLLMAWQEVL